MMECVLARMELGSGLALVLEGRGIEGLSDRSNGQGLDSRVGRRGSRRGGSRLRPAGRQGTIRNRFPRRLPLSSIGDRRRSRPRLRHEYGGTRLKEGRRPTRAMGIGLGPGFFAYLHRRLPFARSALTLPRTCSEPESAYRRYSSVGSRSARSASSTDRRPRRADSGPRRSRMLAIDGTMRIVLMNEAGAKRFRRYEDSDGAVLLGGRIETWRRIDAERASFRDTDARVLFLRSGGPKGRGSSEAGNSSKAGCPGRDSPSSSRRERPGSSTR